jgi:hypothetical protein
MERALLAQNPDLWMNAKFFVPKVSGQLLALYLAQNARKIITKILPEAHQTALANNAPMTWSLLLAPRQSTIASLSTALHRIVASPGFTRLPVELPALLAKQAHIKIRSVENHA